jgi:kinesin family member 5
MINKSLTTLGMVINNLTDGKSTFVPYRDSKLTRVLQESLGGNARTALIVTCSPAKDNSDETVSTLKFGQRAKNIKNKAKVNKDESLAELKKKCEDYEKEISQLKTKVDKLERQLK